MLPSFWACAIFYLSVLLEFSVDGLAQFFVAVGPSEFAVAL
jgi:hypothetical protein